MPPKFECDCCQGRIPPGGLGLPPPPHARAVERHLIRFAGRLDAVEKSRGPGGLPVDIYIAGPTNQRPFCVLLTAGLSNLPLPASGSEDDGFRWAELSICLPSDWRFTRKAQRKAWWWWPVRELLSWCRYPHESGRRIWYHHTVGSAGPLAPNLPFENMLLHPSHALPEEYWRIPVSGERDIWVLSLYPLHPAEHGLWSEHGAHALIDRLEENGVTDLFDPLRKSVVT